MESLPARDADAIHASLEMVDKADIYIGIYAWRYGHIPEGYEISITEMEFNRALERQIPILIFLSHKEHPITVEMFEAGDVAQMKLAALKDRATKGRGRREFKSPAELRAHVIQALSDHKQRKQQLGSPTDAIRALKQRFEQLHPRLSFDITATAESTNVQIRPIHPSAGFPKFKFLKEDRTVDIKAFLEKGQPFRVKAANVVVDDSPIHKDLLRELADAEITFTGLTFDGCLQFHFGSQTEPLCIQVDGKWVLAPKRVTFNGQLRESPLTVSFIRERGPDGRWTPEVLNFKFNWGAWEGQALLALAYFAELEAFLRQDRFFLRSYIRGWRESPAEELVLNDPAKEKGIGAMDWLQKCKLVAQSIGANPPFPAANAVNETQSDDVRLLVELIESGFHEQGMVGEELVISGEGSPKDIPIGGKGLKVRRTESFRKMNFFGIEIPFGPLIHTWTDLELVATRPESENRTELTFKGGAQSKWRIEYKHPDAPAS